MPIVNGINLDEYDFGDSATSDSLSSSPKQTVNGINLSEYDFGEEKQKTIAPSPEETPEASFLRRVPDLGVSLLKGAVGIPEAVVGLLDIPTMGYAGKAVEGAGIRFKETQEILDSLYSPQQQAVNKEVADTKGFFPTIGKAFENPSFILQTVAESAPSMLGAGGIGRGLIKFFPKLAPVIAGAAGEGLVSGGQAAEQIRQGEESGLLSAGQAGIAGLSGMLTGILGVVGGKLAKRLGIVDIDTLIAGGSVRAAVDDATAVAKKNVLRKMIESAISEGAFEELPQSLQEQMSQNVATGKPATEGVAEAGALGMLAGGAMGAFGGAGGHVLSGMEILQKDKVNQDRSQEIQTFVANKGYADLNNNDLLQAYMESEPVQKDLPDDTGLSDSMAIMKSELEKRGIWPEDKLSVDIETKMAELDAKLGNPVQESSDAVIQAERSESDGVAIQAEKPTSVPSDLPLFQTGEDIKKEQANVPVTEPPIASSPSSFFSMPKVSTQEVKEEKTPSTLPLTELSEEGMANPPSTPEKTSQEAIQEKATVSDNLKDGQIKTLSGRVLTPPVIRTSSNAIATKDSKKADDWLRKEAIEEAKAKGDEFAGDQFKMANPARMTQAEREGMHDYLFGETKNIFVLESKKPSTKPKVEKKKADVPKVQTVGESSKKGSPVFKTIEPTTKNGTVKFNVANTGEDFLISTPSGAKIDGYVKNADFPGAKSSPTRGEIFYSEVPATEQKQGTGMALHIDALSLMRANGVKTVNMSPVTPAGQAVVNKLIREGYISKALRTSETGKAEHKILDRKEKKPSPKSKPQSELTLESYARKHKINFNIPGHTNKEAISDGLLSYTKNDAVGLDKAAEEMQGLGLLGTTPDEYATAGDYLYAELQKIVYNRINKKAQSLTAEEDQAIKEMKEALKRDGYDESGIEKEESESDRTGKKEAYSIKDSEAHGEAQSFLEEDDEFVKEEDEEATPTEPESKSTPTTELFDTSSMFTLSGNQPVEQKTMKVNEKKGERLLEVKKQSADELKDRLSGEKAKRELEEEKKQAPVSFPHPYLKEVYNRLRKAKGGLEGLKRDDYGLELAGDNAVLRSNILSAITGKKVAKANSGINALMKAVREWLEANLPAAELKGETARTVEPDKHDLKRLAGPAIVYRAGKPTANDQWEFGISGVFFGGSKEVAGIYGNDIQTYHLNEPLNPLIVAFDEDVALTSPNVAVTDLATVTLPDGTKMDTQELGKYAEANGHDSIIMASWDHVNRGITYSANIFVLDKGLSKIDELSQKKAPIPADFKSFVESKGKVLASLSDKERAKFTKEYNEIKVKEEEGQAKLSVKSKEGEKDETDNTASASKDSVSSVESIRSLEILKREFEQRIGKPLDMEWATQVRVPDVLAEGVGRISKVFGKEVIWVELADTAPFFNGVVSDQIPDKVFINAKTKEPYLFILGHEMLHKMKFESPELYTSLLAETKKYLKDRKGIARMSELDREEIYADFVGEAFTSETYWNHLQKNNPTLFEKAIQIAKEIIDKVVKVLNIDSVSPKYLSDVRKVQTIIADTMDKYAKETGVDLKVGTVSKGNLLSDKDSQALVTDILSILADGSSINFVGKIDPNRPDIQKALAQWKQGNLNVPFTIEGMHKKVIVDGNKMASLIEVAMKGSSDIKLTAWHEAWHSIDEIFLTANEKKILAEKLTPDIERQADIFAKYAANQKHLLPKSAKPIFERIREFFEKVGNYLKDRGFTNAEDVFNRALRGELKERTARWTGDGDSALQISAKHGSPFVFDRFTTDKIGSGEGGQMFGWGLYFTDRDSIAKHYAENLGKGELKIQGRTWSQASDTFKQIISTWLKSGNFDYVKKMVNQSIENVEKLPNSLFAHDRDVLTEIKREIDKGEQSFYDNVKYKESSRNLYNVTLHKGKDPSEYHYMDWEKSIGKELATVIENAVGKEYLEKKFFTNQNQVREFNGATAYNFLEDYLADGNDLPDVTVEDYNYPKAVSLFLLRNGIDGIKYPAGTMSVGKTDAFNYVVFDENAVTIEDRVSFKMGNGKLNAAFRKWFGNSKVVDENGEPLVVYHGTTADFETFEEGYGKTFKNRGIFFTDSKDAADAFASDNKVVSVYLAIENPLVIDGGGKHWLDLEFEGKKIDADDLANIAKERGRDGVILRNVKDPYPLTQNSYIVFRPTQIKSVYNQGTWDENDPRISFKITPVIKNLIDRNAKKAVNPESSFKDGEPDFKREVKEVLGKDYSNWKAHFYLPFFKGHGPNAEPMWKRAFDNTEAGREKRSELNTHYVRKMHNFFDMPKEKTRNIEKVLSEGDAVLAQRIRDLTLEAISAKEGGNLELSQQLREQAQAIKILNRYSDEELAEGITLRTGEVINLTSQEIKVYADVRTAFDEMHRDQFKHQIEMVFGKHRDKAWYSSMIDLFEDRPDSPEFTSEKRIAMKALNKLALNKIRGKKAETIQRNRQNLMDVLKSHISSVSGITDNAELNSAANGMLKAYKEEKVLMNAIKKARNRIGQQVAYFPRVREKGNVYLNIFKIENKTDKNGEEKAFKTMIHSQVVKNAEGARELWAQYKSNPDRKNENLSYKFGAVNKETDSTYVGVNDMNLQRVIDNAIERLRSTRNLEGGELLDGLKLSMVQAVANEMKSRGFGKSSITRRLNLIEGYKKTDLQKVALDYITGMTGMMTKQETAMNFHDILKDIPRDKPKLYNDIGKYAQDMLRNQNTFDRASGKARGVTFIYYLGGNLKSALIQLTQNHVTGIPKLAEKMREWGVKGIAEAKYHKAMADAATIRVNKNTGEVTGKRLNQWEKRLLTEFLHRGNTADQYMQYITGRMQNELGQKFGAVMNVLSKPFGKMETFNRESASIAMFRMAWEHYAKTIPDLEERYAKAYEEAKEYVNFTHFAYGRENLPRIATGGDLASVSARTLLTFRSFNHNYIQSIFGSKDWKTMAHSLAYVALFGGMMGLPFIKDLSDLLEKLTGKSYIKSAREIMRKFGGKTLETFGVQGLPALAGANISGSMAIGIPFIGETPTDTVTGVMGGMYDKARKGVMFAAKGEAYKAAESLLPEMVANPMKALRMSDVGKEYLGTPGYATTSSGKPVFDENGKPLKMTMTDMALKTIGINPSEYSMKNEAQRSVSNIEEYFSDWKTSIYETYRAGRTSNSPRTISKALRQIREYNQAIIDKGVMGLIPRIKMSNVVKAAKIEMSKKQKREARYKRNYLAS